MATIASLAIEVQAKMQSYNKGIASTVAETHYLADEVETVSQKMEVMEKVSRRSSVQLATGFIRSCRESVENIIHLGKEVEITTRKIATLTGEVIDFAAHSLPVSDAVRLGMIGVSHALGTVIKYGLMLAAMAVVIAYWKGMTIQMAMATVTANYLANSLVLLAAKVALFTGIPLLIAMAISAEMANRKIAALNGTLTPLQQAAEAVAEAWQKWSQIIAGGMLDGFAVALWAVSKSLAFIADLLKFADDATGGWLVSLLRMTGTLMGFYTILMAVNVGFRMLANLAIFKPIIAGINATIAASRALFVAQNANIVAQHGANSALSTYIWLQTKATAVALWNRVIGSLGMVATGITSCVIGTSAWIVAQLGLNSAMTYFVALTVVLPLIAAAIWLIVEGVKWMWQWFNSSRKEAELSEEAAKKLQEVSEKYRNGLRETIELHKGMTEAINKYHDAAKTPAQITADRNRQLQDLIEEPLRLKKQIDDLTADIESRKKLIANQTQKGVKDELLARNEEAIKTLNELQEMQSKLKPMTQETIAAYNAETLANEMSKRDVAKYLPQITAQEELDRATREIEELLATGKIDLAKRNAMLDSAVQTFEQNDEAKKLIGKFSDMIKTPIQGFTELSEQLRSVRDAMEPQDFAAAKQKLLDDLKSQMGIAKYFEDADSLAGRQNSLSEFYAILEQYAQASGWAESELLDAKRRAAKSLEQQSDVGRLMLEATEKLKPVAQKLEDAYAKIDAEAAAWTWSRDVVDKMKDMTFEKLMGKAEANSAKSGDNQALVKGATAYLDFQRRDVSKDHIKAIKDNSVKQTAYAKTTAEKITTIADNRVEYETIG